MFSKLPGITLLAILCSCGASHAPKNEKAGSDLIPSVAQAADSAKEEKVIETGIYVGTKHTLPKNILSELKKKPEIFEVLPGKDTTLTVGNKGTVIHIPENAFVFPDGHVVSDPVKLIFSEYRNAAEIAFSQIAMTYSKDGQTFNFNSAGMFEISGFVGKSKVEIANEKLLAIDYAIAQKTSGLGFYQLDKKANKWEKLVDIQPQQNQEVNPVKGEKMPFVNGQLRWKLTMSGGSAKAICWNVKENQKENLPEKFLKEFPKINEIEDYLNENPPLSLSYNFTFDVKKRIIKNVRSDDDNREHKFDEDIISFFENLPPSSLNAELISKLERKDYACEFIFRPTWEQSFVSMFEAIGPAIEDGRRIPRGGCVFSDDPTDRTSSTLLASGMNAGHTYPDIIRGLQMSSFGVYNCDQIYRVKNQVNIVARYIDEKSNAIVGGNVLSLIDCNYNGAFSFDPSGFSCDSKAENILLLFTDSGKMYMLQKGEFQKMKITESGTYSFSMKDVTSQFKSSDDLAEYIGLKE